MVNKISLLKIFAFFALLIFLPVTVYAGADAPPSEPSSDAPPPPPPPEEEPEGMGMFGTTVDILPTSFYTTYFFHNPHISESAFTLRISQYGVVAGCAHLQEGSAPRGKKAPFEGKSEIKYLSNRLVIETILPETANSDGEPRYTNYDCETKHLEAYTDIDLDRDELLQNNIDTVSFNINGAEFGTYILDITKDRLILKNKENDTVIKIWLRLWFFPKDTIKLYVPQADSDMNVIQEIRDFGLAHGLVPIDEVLNGYTLPHHANDYAYFIDPKKILSRDMSLENNNKQVGEIGVAKTYYGPGGAQEKIKPMPIHASIVTQRKIWK